MGNRLLILVLKNIFRKTDDYISTVPICVLNFEYVLFIKYIEAINVLFITFLSIERVHNLQSIVASNINILSFTSLVEQMIASHAKAWLLKDTQNLKSRRRTKYQRIKGLFTETTKTYNCF